MRKLRWRVAAAEPPTGRPVKAGVLEATDQTMLVGFHGRYRHPRRGQCQSLAHRRALGIALRQFRFRTERDSRAQISRGGPGARRGDLYRRRRPSRGCARAGAGAGSNGRKRAILRKRGVAPDETALNQMLNVRQHRKRRCVEEPGVRVAVDDGHDGRASCCCRRGCNRGSPVRACAGAAGRPSPGAAVPRPGRRDRGSRPRRSRAFSRSSERM